MAHSELDKRLQQLATTNWEQFMEIVGKDFIITAKARLLRKEGKSWQQISVKLETTPSKARTACKDRQKLTDFDKLIEKIN